MSNKKFKVPFFYTLLNKLPQFWGKYLKISSF